VLLLFGLRLLVVHLGARRQSHLGARRQSATTVNQPSS
jgi:hypothetical protein